jgi:hypothetical protein
VVVVTAFVTATPLGWAAGAVIISGAVLGGFYGIVHGARVGSYENTFWEGLLATASDPGDHTLFHR